MRKTVSRDEDFYDSHVFQILMDYEITRSKRYPSPLSLLDIEMNPTATNDETHRAAPSLFASVLTVHLRSVDIPYGTGNRFKVLLPTTNEAGVKAICERLISVFRTKFDTEDGSSIAFTLNIGGVAHPGGASLASEILLGKAEDALKQSIQKGPNIYILHTISQQENLD